jgi:glucose-1-phosphate thymidylyltransferase
MKVLILAAGYGTRLYPLIMDTPKPLLPIGDQPLINHLLDRIEGLKRLKEVIVVTNHKFYGHFLKWADQNKNFVVPIKILDDGTNSPDDRLGSVGDILFALKNHPVKDDLLIIGGDNLFDYNLSEYIRFAREKRPLVTIGLYDIGKIEEAKNFGVVKIDRSGQVTSFEEKPQNPQSSLVAMCFYHLPKVTLPLVDEYLQKSKKADKAGDYIRWLVEKKGVYGFSFKGTWYDIGSIEAYHEAQEKFKKK